MAKETKRRLPSELTHVEARTEGERLRERRRAADRIAAPLFAQQMPEEELNLLLAQIPHDPDEPLTMDGLEYPEATGECSLEDGLSGILEDRDEPLLPLEDKEVPCVPRPKS